MSQDYHGPLDADKALSPQISDVSDSIESLRSSFSGNTPPTDPAPVEGQLWWDDFNNQFYVFNGANWTPIAGRSAWRAEAGNAALTVEDYALGIDASGGNAVVDVVSAVGINGTSFAVIKLDSSANTVTVDPDGTELIAGESSWVLRRHNEGVLFISDGANWRVIASWPGILADGEIIIGDSGDQPKPGSITGTANQIIVTPGAGSITLSTPQDIHTDADVQFDSAFLGGNEGERALAIGPSAILGGSPRDRIAIHDGAQTTDANFTKALTLELTESGYCYNILAQIQGHRTGGAAGAADDSAGYVIAGTFKNSSGVVTQVATTTVIHSAEDQAGWDADFNISGTDVEVRVKGATDNNVDWWVIAEMARVKAVA
jgi:hypothetical protein